MRILLSLFILILLSGTSFAAEFSVENGKLIRSSDGVQQILEASEFASGVTAFSPTLYAVINSAAAAKLEISPSILFFSQDGTFLRQLDYPEADECDLVSLSPDGSMLALSMGGAFVRSLTLYSYPGFSVMGDRLTYVRFADSPAPSWSEDALLFYNRVENSIDAQPDRTCDYEECGSVSVVSLEPRLGEFKVWAQGNPLCDYRLLGIRENILRIAEVCSDSEEDWQRERRESPFTELEMPLNVLPR